MTEFYARKPGDPSWRIESTLLFMMTSFLKSRTDTGHLSNTEFYDEDVNVYLAGVLASYVDSSFMDMAGRYISPFDIDIARMARRADERSRYTIYKVNADHLLVSAGIFEPTPQPEGDQAPPDQARTAIGRGTTYYRLAASYGRALARRGTAAIEVLEKLSRGFPSYVNILNHLRSEYFNLIEGLDPRAMDEIRDRIDDEAEKAELTTKVNRLLDLYSEWLKTKNPELLGPMNTLAAEIKRSDPTFAFKTPEA